MMMRLCWCWFYWQTCKWDQDEADLRILDSPGTQGNAETDSGAAAQEEEEDGDDEDDDQERHPGPEELIREASDDVRSAGAGHCHIYRVCKM